MDYRERWELKDYLFGRTLERRILLFHLLLAFVEQRAVRAHQRPQSSQQHAAQCRCEQHLDQGVPAAAPIHGTNLEGARFTGLRRASGIRPDVYVGWAGFNCQARLRASCLLRLAGRL